jgi:ABC-2 type transport system ATP-binding protein
MLKVDDVTKAYGKKAILDHISFRASPGEVIGLVGENGAGKSTLLELLATVRTPSHGEITLSGKSYRKDRKAIRRHIGYVPQEIAVWEDLTVEENMVFFGELSWKKKSRQQLRQLCLDMKLEKWPEPVKSLSGGMKRKLNIAISLIHDPELLLLDEPTAGIDLKSRTEIGSYLQERAKMEGKIILYTSHDMDEIRQLCDRIFFIGNDPFYRRMLTEAGKEVISL